MGVKPHSLFVTIVLPFFVEVDNNNWHFLSDDLCRVRMPCNDGRIVLQHGHDKVYGRVVLTKDFKQGTTPSEFFSVIKHI